MLRIEPLIRCFATDVTLCGGTQRGKARAKILNNMVLFETVSALSEAVAVAKQRRRSEIAAHTLSKGSAEWFALRNHGMKAIVPGNFPEQSVLDPELCAEGFILCVAELAEEDAIRLRGAELMGEILQEAIDAGSKGGAYLAGDRRSMSMGA